MRGAVPSLASVATESPRTCAGRWSQKESRVMKFEKAKPVSLKAHGTFNEKWLQERLAEDPGLLGLEILKSRMWRGGSRERADSTCC